MVFVILFVEKAFYLVSFWPPLWGLRDLSSLTRDQTQALGSESAES